MLQWLSSKQGRLSVVLGVSLAFFAAEIAVGFKTGSLALIADAFHYLNDIISYAMALVATSLKQKMTGPPGYTFAWKRAEIVGAFFNASFLLALGVSIFLQAIERFVNLPDVDHPLWVLIVGCVGLVLNILCMSIVHEHGHGHSHGHGHADGESPNTSTSAPTNPANPAGEPNETLDYELNRMQAPGFVDHTSHKHNTPRGEVETKSLGMAGVALHLMGDAVNNIGVIIAAAIMWKTDSPHRFYADPAASLAIALIIIGGAVPLTLRSARVLLEAAPKSLSLADVQKDLESIPHVEAIHDVHIWHLTEGDLLATFHCRTTAEDMTTWRKVESELHACLRAYGVGHVTIAPEYGSAPTDECHLGCD